MNLILEDTMYKPFNEIRKTVNDTKINITEEK